MKTNNLKLYKYEELVGFFLEKNYVKNDLEINLERVIHSIKELEITEYISLLSKVVFNSQISLESTRLFFHIEEEEFSLLQYHLWHTFSGDCDDVKSDEGPKIDLIAKPNCNIEPIYNSYELDKSLSFNEQITLFFNIYDNLLIDIQTISYVKDYIGYSQNKEQAIANESLRESLMFLLNYLYNNIETLEEDLSKYLDSFISLSFSKDIEEIDSKDFVLYPFVFSKDKFFFLINNGLKKCFDTKSLEAVKRHYIHHLQLLKSELSFLSSYQKSTDEKNKDVFLLFVDYYHDIENIIVKIEQIEFNTKTYVKHHQNKNSIPDKKIISKRNFTFKLSDLVLSRLHKGLEKEGFIDIYKTNEEDFKKTIKLDWANHESIIHLEMDHLQTKLFFDTIKETFDVKISLKNIENSKKIKNKNGFINANNLSASSSRNKNMLPKKANLIIEIIMSSKKG